MTEQTWCKIQTPQHNNAKYNGEHIIIRSPNAVYVGLGYFEKDHFGRMSTDDRNLQIMKWDPEKNQLYLSPKMILEDPRENIDMSSMVLSPKNGFLFARIWYKFYFHEDVWRKFSLTNGRNDDISLYGEFAVSPSAQYPYFYTTRPVDCFDENGQTEWEQVSQKPGYSTLYQYNIQNNTYIKTFEPYQSFFTTTEIQSDWIILGKIRCCPDGCHVLVNAYHTGTNNIILIEYDVGSGKQTNFWETTCRTWSESDIVFIDHEHIIIYDQSVIVLFYLRTKTIQPIQVSELSNHLSSSPIHRLCHMVINKNYAKSTTSTLVLDIWALSGFHLTCHEYNCSTQSSKNTCLIKTPSSRYVHLSVRHELSVNTLNELVEYYEELNGSYAHANLFKLLVYNQVPFHVVWSDTLGYIYSKRISLNSSS